MDKNKTALERAFELARSGRYPTVQLIRRAISAEGYSQNQIEGRELTRQLKALISAATPDST
jgi:flagellar biosynthesis/type III secretory pathway protein FliH